MSDAPYAIAGAAAIFAAVRLSVRIRRRKIRRGEDDDTPVAARPGEQAHDPRDPRDPRDGRRLLGDTGLVARREIRERLRGRFFKVVTLLLLVIVAVAIIIPTLHTSSGTHGPTKVGITGSLTGAVKQDLIAEAKKSDITVRLVPIGSVRRAKAELASGALTLVVESGGSVLVTTASMVGGSTTTGQLASTFAALLGFLDTVAHDGLTPAQAAAVVHSRPVPVHSVERAARNGSGRSVSTIGLILTFVMLTQYLTWTLMGILEEKTSRVVEVLLATVRPVQLLAGKVLGIGAVALAQAVVIVAFALVLAAAVGSDLLQGTGPAVVFTTLLWLVLGYAFYSWVYAAAGSMAARQDQVQSLAFPLSVPIIIGYIVALTNSGPGTPSGLVTVFAYLPPTAPFAMPVLVAHGVATWWEVVLSALISLACTVVVARGAAGIYRRAVLRTGRRVSLRELVTSQR